MKTMLLWSEELQGCNRAALYGDGATTNFYIYIFPLGWDVSSVKFTTPSWIYQEQSLLLHSFMGDEGNF